jgi:hypothetical protein
VWTEDGSAGIKFLTLTREDERLIGAIVTEGSTKADPRHRAQ